MTNDPCQGRTSKIDGCYSFQLNFSSEKGWLLQLCQDNIPNKKWHRCWLVVSTTVLPFFNRNGMKIPTYMLGLQVLWQFVVGIQFGSASYAACSNPLHLVSTTWLRLELSPFLLLESPPRHRLPGTTALLLVGVAGLSVRAIFCIEKENDESLVGGLVYTFFISPYIGKNNPNWRTHIFQRGRYTTNQINNSDASGIFDGSWGSRFWDKDDNFCAGDVIRSNLWLEAGLTLWWTNIAMENHNF